MSLSAHGSPGYYSLASLLAEASAICETPEFPAQYSGTPLNCRAHGAAGQVARSSGTASGGCHASSRLGCPQAMVARSAFSMTWSVGLTLTSMVPATLALTTTSIF